MMITLKTNHCDWDKNTRREMTLYEFVRQLPINHCARKEFKALQADIARLKEILDKIQSTIQVAHAKGDMIPKDVIYFIEQDIEALKESEGMEGVSKEMRDFKWKERQGE